MGLEFGKDDLEYIKETLLWLNQHTVLINDNRTNCETEHSRTQNSLTAIERGLAQCSDENAVLPINSVSFSLRDKIAMHALNGLYASHANPQAGSPIHIDVEESAKHCYKIADALLKARSNES